MAPIEPEFRRGRVEAFVETLSLRKAVGAVVAVAVALGAVGATLLKVVNPGAFDGPGDAIWLALVTVTTVGFGDVIPTNTAGRLVTAMIALLGISLIPALTSLVTSILVTRRAAALSALQDVEQAQILALLQQIEERLGRLEARRP